MHDWVNEEYYKKIMDVYDDGPWDGNPWDKDRPQSAAYFVAAEYRCQRCSKTFRQSYEIRTRYSR